MRLIDADALKDVLKTELANVPQPDTDADYYVGVRQGLKLAETIINNAPTVEERPQVVIFSENMTAEEKQKLIAEFKAVMDNAKFTIEPERPQGEWIVDEDNDLLNFMKCSNCGEVAEWLDGGSQFLSKFCPNCGAQMKGGAENEN